MPNYEIVTGLQTDPTNNANTASGGWEFKADDNITIVGLRGYARSTYMGTIKFGTSGGTVLAEKSVALVANEWVSVMLDTPITLTSGSNYVVMLFGTSGTLKYQNNPTTADDITYIRGKFGTFPGTSESNTAYSVDVLIGYDTAQTYTVQYNANGGSGTMADQEINRNVETALSFNAFTRADHAFAGWATTPNGAVQYTNGQTVLNIAEANETIVLYAVWQYLTPTYTIAYSANGGSGAMAPTLAQVHTPVTLTLCAFVRPGYSFLGWATTPSGMIQFTDGATVTDLAPSNTTVILYAIWGNVTGFEITLQTNESETNRITKSIKTIATYDGTLRDSTSIIDPVIMIECNLGNVTGCNYITVPAFGRSYFVTNITSVRDGLVEFQCHVDVLSSFAKDIKSNTGIIRRAEHKDLYNLYLNDGSLKSYQDPYILTEPFPQGFSGWGFILAVAGD